MAHRLRAAISWSGGKDSLAALTAARDTYDVVAAITMFDAQGLRSRSHGLRPELVASQASQLGLRALGARCEWPTYNAVFTRLLRSLRLFDITDVIFGDILFPEHREWAEARCAEAGLRAVEPLWGQATDVLLDACLAAGTRALLVTVRRPFLDEHWLGHPLDASLKLLFAERGIDPCGERGEYHTAVVDGPAFARPIAVDHGIRVVRGDCTALDLIPRDVPATSMEWLPDTGAHDHAASR